MSIHYDPMLAKVISYAPSRARAAQVLADTGAAAVYTAPIRTATCWSMFCATPRSSPGPPTRRSSIPMDCPGSLHLSPTITLSGCRRSQPHSRMLPTTAEPRALFPDCRVVGGTSRRDISTRLFAMIPIVNTRFDTGSPVRFWSFRR